MTPSRLVMPALVWACFFAAAAAQGEEEYDRTGIYIGAAGAYAFENFENGSSGVRARNELGYNVRAGYRAHSFVAVESSSSTCRSSSSTFRTTRSASMMPISSCSP